MAELKKGDFGPDVVTLQGWLMKMSYLPSSSGLYDDDTVGAVWRFQEDHQLPTSGECDQTTWNYLEHYAAQPEPAPAPADTPAPPASGTQAVVDQQGNVLQYVEAEKLDRAGDIDPFDTVTELLVRQAPGLGLLVDEAIALASANAVTVAFGLDLSAAAILGVSAGVGLYASNTGELGWYLSAGADLGVVLGISGALAVTIVHGPPERLGGWCWGVQGFAAFGAMVGGAVLFDTDGNFLGTVTKVGIGAGGGVYASVQYTKLRTF